MSCSAAYAVQFILSERELDLLAERLPAFKKVQAKCASPKSRDVAALVRSHSRLYVKSYVLLAAISALAKYRGSEGLSAGRIAGSVTAVSASYRVLYYLLGALKDRMRTADKYPHPAFKSKLAVPIASGLLSGTALALVPTGELRPYIALYTASKALEYLYNYFDDHGYLKNKPRVMGSWMLFPIAFSQLFHTFIFHPDCTPPSFSKLLFKLSDGYVPAAPSNFTADDHWPTPEQVVSGIADISRLGYPRFVSPIMFPHKATVAPALKQIEPVVSIAHPAITTMTGALLHPYQPSEFRTYVDLILEKFGSVSKYVFALYLIFGFVRSGGKNALPVTTSAVANAIRTTLFVVMTGASAWSGIGVAQKFFGPRFIPLYRYRVIGFISGLWAFLDQVNGRSRYLFTARMAVRSYWKVLVKTGKVKPIPYGDVALFSLSFAVIMAILDHAPGSISPPRLRKALNWARSGKFTDAYVAVDKKQD